MLRGDLGLPYSRDPAGAAAASWSPSDLASLKYWWKTDSSPTTITIETGVSSWVDEQESLDLVQSDTTKQPALASSYLNGLDGVQFDGSNDFLDAPTFTALNAPTTIAGIWGVQTNASGDYLWESSNNSNRRAFLQTTASRWQIYAGASLVGGTYDTNDHYSVVEYSGTGFLRIDGAEILSGNVGTQDMVGFILGANAVGGAPGAVTFVEVMIIDGSLSAEDLTSLESYLSDRSGI